MNDENELSHDARALLAEARGGDDPSPGDRARVRRTLMATIAGTAGLAASSAASSAAAASAGTVATTAGLSLGAKIAAVVLVVGAVGGGTVAVAPWEDPEPVVVEHREHRARAVEQEQTEIAPSPAIEPTIEPMIEPAIEIPAPIEAPVEIAPRAARTVRAPPPAIAPPAPSASTLAEEVALLRSAQSALNAGDADGALSRLADHARRFPTGTMAEERDAARILALCRAGRRDEARDAAARFLRERPSSPLAARVRASCD